MKFAKIMSLMLCLTLMFCGCSKESDVALKINDTVITKKEFNKEYNRLLNVSLKNAPKEIKKNTSFPALSIKKRYIEDLIVQTLLEQEFQKRNITAKETEVAQKKEEIIKRIGSEEQFEMNLRRNNVSIDKLRKDLTREVKIEKLLEKVGVKEKTEADALKYYKANKAQFSLPERVRVSQILIGTNIEEIKREIVDADANVSLTTEAVEQRANEELKKRKELATTLQAKASANPSTFEKLAKEYSHDKRTVNNGGDLGYVAKGTILPQLEKAFFAQKVGTVGPIIETRSGLHIFLVKDKAKAGTQSFDEVKADLINYLTISSRTASLRGFIDGIKSKAKIEYVDESLKPEVLEKQLNESLDAEKLRRVPKSKRKVVEKINKEHREKQNKK